jgi:hypothetical protein
MASHTVIGKRGASLLLQRLPPLGMTRVSGSHGERDLLLPPSWSGLSTTVLHFGVQTQHQKTLLLASFLSAFHFSFWWSVVRSPFDEL